MKKRHLKVISSIDNEYHQTFDFCIFLQNLFRNLKCIITPKREKIYVLKDYLIKLYRDYEITTGFCEIPYYLRAELKISEIIQEDKVDYYFKMFEKIRKRTILSKL